MVPDDLAWRAVELPYVAERDRGYGTAGQRAFARVWLRIVDAPGADAPGPRALAYSAYLPSGSDAVLYVDGRRLIATDPTLSNSWHRPVLFPLPYGADGGDGQHMLALSFDCSVGLLGCGVPSLRVGAVRPVTDYLEWQNFLRIDAARVGSAAILIVGTFALLFWIRRRHEVEYALFFCASLLWTVRTLHYHLSHYPQPEDWFWWVTVNSLTWLSVTIYLFAFRACSCCLTRPCRCSEHSFTRWHCVIKHARAMACERIDPDESKSKNATRGGPRDRAACVNTRRLCIAAR